MSGSGHLGICACCRQPLPEAARRDPPLPPLVRPDVVTLHDLPNHLRAKVKIRRSLGDARQIVIPQKGIAL